MTAFLLQDAFHAFHQDLNFVRKFLQPLLIGELAPEEPSQDGPQNVSGRPDRVSNPEGRALGMGQVGAMARPPATAAMRPPAVVGPRLGCLFPEWPSLSLGLSPGPEATEGEAAVLFGALETD